jgi:hypothetical protein
MSFSLVQLLLAERDIPAEVRQAIVEHRLQDAAELLMKEYGLSCVDVGYLFGISGLLERKDK